MIFFQTFLSPQVKGCTIITYKDGRYEVPPRVAKRLKTEDLIELANLRRMAKQHRMIASCQSSCQIENFDKASKNLLKNKN